MAKKCLSCKCEIPEESVIEFCRRCGVGMYGAKTFDTIVENLKNGASQGLLDQGSVSDISQNSGIDQNLESSFDGDSEFDLKNFD